MLNDDELRLDVGRCEGGTFLRLVHVPTGIYRSRGPLRGARTRELVEVWRKEIEAELKLQRLGEYVSSDRVHRDSPKRLSKEEAEAEAVRIAEVFVAASGAVGWTCAGARPNVLAPGYKRRKNVIKWSVVFDRSEVGGSTLDGPVIVHVNVERGNAEFA